MRDIRCSFKTLSGTLHFTENEKNIVNQPANNRVTEIQLIIEKVRKL